MTKGAVFLLIIQIWFFTSLSGVEVKQDKNGRISISNMASNHTPYQNTKNQPQKQQRGIVPLHYLAKIKSLSEKHNVKELLIIAVARAESDFNPFAVSKKGAVGIMQLMAETARIYGVLDRYNVDQNLEAGVQHLKYLLKRYRNSLPLTLAAYNAGEEAVSRYKGVPPYRETRNYIRKVMAFMGKGYSGYFNTRVKKKIYKIVALDGKITITDKLPSKVSGTVSVFE